MESVNFNNMRRAMVDSQLRTSGVTEAWVLAAMGDVAREDYVPAAARATAYMDRSIALGDGNMLNPPATTALLLQAAEIRTDDAVLLVGQEKGYVAALLKERVAKLAAMDAAGLGKPAKSATYTLIIIDGGVEELPDSLLAFAAAGARLVTGMVDGAVTRLAKGYVLDGKVALKPFADGEITPLPAFARKAEFVF